MTALEPRACDACGETYQPVRKDQRYCTRDECKAARKKKGSGAELVPADQAEGQADKTIEGKVISPKSRKQWATIILKDLRKATEAGG
jgi:hypothetical protein